MSNITREKFIQIIEEGNFNALLGNIENDFFDCKEEGYNFDNSKYKRELAKDISSFANLNGGFLLIGLRTSSSPTHLGDIIAELCLMKQNAIDRDRYINIVRDWIYPEIEGIQILWKPYNKDAEKGIFVIEIPSQSDSSKPFLIKKDIEGQKISEVLFGYAQRKLDRSEPKKIQDIHRLIKDGLVYKENIQIQFETLKNLLQQNQMATITNKEIEIENRKSDSDRLDVTQEIDMDELLLNRVTEIQNASDVYSKRTIILIAYPGDISTKLQTLFSNDSGSIKRMLENPPITRNGGWTLETRDIGEIIKGKLVRVQEYRKAIDLYKDGTLVLVGDVENLLCHWQTLNPLKINPLAMIELIYNFVLFYKEVLDDLIQKPGEIYFHFGLYNMWFQSKKTYLIPWRYDSIGQMDESEKYEAQEDSIFSEPSKVKVEQFDIGEVAYQIIKEIYLWFGILPEGNKIPYTKTEGDKQSIDIDQIQNI